MVENLSAKESGQIDWARYDSDTGVLEIDFKGKTPSTYAYDGFPAHEWDSFKAAESKGKFFASHVRFAKNADGSLKYPYRKIK